MRKNFLKLISAVLSFSLILCLSGCSEEKAAKNNLESMIAELKDGNYYEAVTNYIYDEDNSNDFLNCGENFNENAFPAYKMHMAVFDSLKYNIKDTKIISQSEIHFITDITTIDLTPVGEELASMATAYNISSSNAEEDEKLTDSELNDIMTQQLGNISNEYLNGDNVKTVSSEVEIITGYTKEGKWLIYMDEALYNALTGGVYKAFYDVIENTDIITEKKQ